MIRAIIAQVFYRKQTFKLQAALTVFGISGALSFAIGLSCFGGDSNLPAGSPCKSVDECASGLVCVYGRCRDECRFDHECGVGGSCVPHGTGHICWYPSEGGEECPPGTDDIDGICRELCSGVLCPNDRVCIDGFCYDVDADGDADVDGDADIDGDGDGDGDADGDVDGDADGDIQTGDAEADVDEPDGVNCEVSADCEEGLVCCHYPDEDTFFDNGMCDALCADPWQEIECLQPSDCSSDSETCCYAVDQKDSYCSNACESGDRLACMTEMDCPDDCPVDFSPCCFIVPPDVLVGICDCCEW